MPSSRMYPPPERVAAQNAQVREGIVFGREMAAMVPATRLDPADKSAVWREIKANHPARVGFFADPIVQRLMAAGAVPCFPPELIAAARQSMIKRGAKP